MWSLIRHARIIVLILLLSFVYVQSNFNPSPQYQDTEILEYWHSQDIPVLDVPDRIFLSDSQIHESAGYLYVLGAAPTEFNFQHPPLVKYLYGLSIYYFHSAFYVQFIFGLLLIQATVVLAYLISKNLFVSLLAGLLLLTDSLFLSLIHASLLDLALAFWIVMLVICLIIFPQNYFIQGSLIAFIAATKFYATAIVICLPLIIYHWHYNRRKLPRTFLIRIFATVLLIFSLIYIRTILQINFLQFLIFQLKICKYWLHHSVSNLFGNSLVMFTTGWYKNWWEPHQWLRIPTWTWLWPTSLIAFICSLFTRNIKLIIALFPIFIFAALLLQAPFDRYYITIIPFFYISLALLVGKVFSALWASSTTP